MTIPLISKRFLHLFDSGGFGLDLTSVNGRVGAFNPPAINNGLHDLTGSASQNPAVEETGYKNADDWSTDILADTDIQNNIDRWHGVTATHRDVRRAIALGWMGGDVIGQIVQIAEVFQSKVSPKTPPALLTTINLLLRFTGAIHHMTILHELSAETADGDTEASAIDNTASSANGGTGFFGWTDLDLDGGTAFAPRVIDSADDITYGALITFTTVTAAAGYQLVEVAGTVEQYVACDWDFTGAPGGSETATFRIDFERN